MINNDWITNAQKVQRGLKIFMGTRNGDSKYCGGVEDLL